MLTVNIVRMVQSGVLRIVLGRVLHAAVSSTDLRDGQVVIVQGQCVGLEINRKSLIRLSGIRRRSFSKIVNKCHANLFNGEEIASLIKFTVTDDNKRSGLNLSYKFTITVCLAAELG